MTLKAIPKGTIRYTLDGSNPRNGGVCDSGEVVVPEGRDVLLAIAEADGIWSEQLRVDVPKARRRDGEQTFQPDFTRPANGVVGSAPATAAGRSRSWNASSGTGRTRRAPI